MVPPRHLFGLEEHEFTRGYHSHLNAIGAERFKFEFVSLADRTGKAPVLLCFCDIERQFCHRRIFAEWYERMTGDSIPELR